MRVFRGYRFCKELAPIYTLKPILVESIYVSDLRTVDCEVDRELDASDTITRVLLSMNLEI